MKVFKVLFLAIPIFFFTCGTDNPGPINVPGNHQFGDWLIPYDNIYDGGPGKDGIPALLNPKLISAAEASYLSDADLVIGTLVNGEPRAYPHIILDWHEIINDQAGDQVYTINYCPLTGTGMNWKRNINGSINTFGVSGLLYNSNLILYDRDTDSNWSQMRAESVHGRYIGRSADLFPMLETTWLTWKTMYPETMVVSLNTGIDRPYGNYPYVSNQTKEDYREAPFLIFPVTNDDDRLHRKERVLGVRIGGEAKAYRFNDFEGNTIVRTNTIGGQPVVIIGNASKNFMTAYRSVLGGETLSFSGLDQSELPHVMTDNRGNTWDIFGRAVTGPDTGAELIVAEAYIGYWFAWAAFNPEIEIIDF
tara:strand:+ start:7078 stop:8166 length:1089 start_codon:yes stop_codon:yes gene_type:complete